MFAVMLMDNAMQGGGRSYYELHPVLAAIDPAKERAFLGWHIAPERDKLLLGQGAILVAPLFHIAFKDDGQAQRGRDNLGGMARSLHRAGDQYVNFDVLTFKQAVA